VCVERERGRRKREGGGREREGAREAHSHCPGS